MAWNSLDTYRHGLRFFTDVVHGAPADAWSSASPCAGWTALDVLGHVGSATLVGAQILRGDPVTAPSKDVPSSAVTDDPVVWWDAAAADALDAVAAVNEDDLDREVDSPMGRRTVRDGLSFPAVDLFIHGWDVAAATGQSVQFPAEAVEFIRGLFAAIPTEVTRRPGVFAEAVPIGDDAVDTDRVLAFAGRDPQWVRPSEGAR